MQTLIAHARALRAEYPDASTSTRLAWARSATKRNPIEWEYDRDGLPQATLTVDGFTVSVRAGYDEIGQVDWLGEFHERRVAGSICVTAPRSWRQQRVWYKPNVSVDERRRDLRKRGYSKSEADRLARSYVAQDLERLRKYADGDIALLCVSAIASRAGVQLGRAAVGGVDVDKPDDDYISDLAADMIAEAVAEAKAALAKLCGCGQ
jgi:hypothetical protein